MKKKNKTKQNKNKKHKKNVLSMISNWYQQTKQTFKNG